MAKAKLSVTLDKGRVKWLREKVNEEVYRNCSHGLDLALKLLIEQSE